MALALLLASGVALAVTRVGTPRDDTLRGTDGPDQIDGRTGDDDIFSLGGSDTLYDGKGRDRLVGGPQTKIGFLRSSGDKVMVGGPGDDTLLGGKGTDTLAGVRARTFLSTAHSKNPNGTCWQAVPVKTSSMPPMVQPRATSLVVALAGIPRKSTARK
jgi:Ca2+-binding RTX toxin-like protein